jgi:hypothetical protein
VVFPLKTTIVLVGVHPLVHLFLSIYSSRIYSMISNNMLGLQTGINPMLF